MTNVDSLLLGALVCQVFVWIGIYEMRDSQRRALERVVSLQDQVVRLARVSTNLRERLQKQNDGAPLPEAVKRAAAGKLAYEFADCINCGLPIRKDADERWVHGNGDPQCQHSHAGYMTFATPVRVSW
jgi:hypothetical protein